MPLHVDNSVLGAGKIYFSLFNADGSIQGFRYLGDTPSFSITASTEKVEKFSSDNAVATKIESVVTQANYSASFNCEHIDGDNLAMFYLGEKSTVAQGAGAVLDEELTVKQGRWYPLGLTANKTGVRNIEDIVIQDETDTTTYVLDTDYEVDLVNGRIYIIEGGGIADDDVIHVDYDTVAESREQVVSAGQITEGALQFIADNTTGTNRNGYFPKVKLEPTGEFSLKSRDTWQNLGFNAELLELDSQTAAIYFDGPSAA